MQGATKHAAVCSGEYTVVKGKMIIQNRSDNYLTVYHHRCITVTAHSPDTNLRLIYNGSGRAGHAGGDVRRIGVLSDGMQLPYRDVLQHWQHDAGVREYFGSLLSEAPFSAFFWESRCLVLPICLSQSLTGIRLPMASGSYVIVVRPFSTS